MDQITKIFIGASLLLLPNIAIAKEKPAPTVLRDENLVQSMPSGFKVGFRDVKPDYLIQEMVSEHESVEDWSEMITTQVFKGHGDWLPGKYLVKFGQSIVAICPAETHSNIMNGNANGYPTSFLAIQCPINPQTGKPEHIFLRAIQGKDSFYLVQVAYRHIPSREEVDALLLYLQSIVACDTRSPDHPCPDMAAAGFKAQ